MNRKERRAAGAGQKSNVNLSELFSQAIYFHRAGRLQEAEKLYAQILAVEPNHPEVLNFYGICQSQQGRNIEAEKILRKSLALNPARFEPYSDLAVILKAQGKFDEALQLLQKSVAINPNFDDGLYNLANEYMRRGAKKEAIENFEKSVSITPNFDGYNNLCLLYKDSDLGKAEAYGRKALEMNPSSPEVLSNLGIVLGNKYDFENAEKYFLEALRIRPNFADAYNNLGFIQQRQKKFLEAKENYEKAILHKPLFPDALTNLGAVLCEIKDFPNAAAVLEKSLIMESNNVEAMNNLGLVLMEQKRYEEAEEIFKRALEVKPDFADVYNSYGYLMEKTSKLERAIKYFRKAGELRPNYIEAFNNISFALQGMGKVKEAVENSKKIFSLKPDYYQARSNMLFSMHYDEYFTNQNMFEEAKLWGELHAPESLIQYKHAPREKGRKLKIGYVSGDLKSHPVGYFLCSVLEQHDKSKFAIYAYSNHHVKDEYTRKIITHVDYFADIYKYNDNELARIINNEKIDVLIDLSGHTVLNRLLTFARKPAPVQMSWLGYFNTTGLKQIDYILGDRFVTPSQNEKYFTEKILRMPDSYLCFSTPEFDIEPGEAPHLENGYITFGCFNNLNKVSNSVIMLWAGILKKLPTAKLFLKTFNLDDEFSRKRIIAAFADQGIGEERLIIEGGASRDELIKCYKRVDIALDTFPYNGGTTTVEALWMGVPVISLEGESFVARVGASILENLNLSEFILQNKESYIEAAVELAGNSAKISDLRKNLRNIFNNSALSDAKRFTRNFEAILTEIAN